MTRGFSSILSDSEILKLFLSIDADKSNSVSYQEMLVCFKEVHLNYILHKLNLAITSGKLTPAKVFNASDLDQDKTLDVVEFNEMVGSAY